MRRPGRKRVADLRTVKEAVRVHVAGVEHEPNRSPADVAAAQPDQRAQAIGQLAEIEHVARRERVEVSGEKMEAVLMAGDARREARAARSRDAARSTLSRARSDARRRSAGRRARDRSRGRRGATVAGGAIRNGAPAFTLMKPSDSPRDDAHCAIPVRAAIFSTTAGTVAS